MTAPVTRAQQLLRLAIDSAASPEEQRTAALALAKLIAKDGLVVVEGISVQETESRGKRRGRRAAEEASTATATGPAHKGTKGVKTTDWCVYIAAGYAFCQGCGGSVEEGEAFYTHGRIGLRCTGCYHVHGVRI